MLPVRTTAISSYNMVYCLESIGTGTDRSDRFTRKLLAVATTTEVAVSAVDEAPLPSLAFNPPLYELRSSSLIELTCHLHKHGLRSSICTCRTASGCAKATNMAGWSKEDLHHAGTMYESYRKH